ncbi:YihY/virulence factor BrkB family protein [Aurantimonas sp. C2-6-R+9]|uniref:YihY/virulence factor BrkB family protein n=1 Tax=unclassified Aurantimonas TaxID=2638230 RepID=UPI002E193C08|nr:MULTISPECIES: YihY/virulence factor BrkB family protein [unclassified Aurantimonas]MEC5289723.1 YihY/virulence factor BrkB family protein [Aurantimonas sp. C2-3-R2]MEC5379689.1 YihY/virulence factor BrkB family protein [Aurantimonas sp. C2-6-R+9]MEC5410840.1 YihY/virulence factor BrkB family protein [Aurantimonas sp. C2-4-R8]
MTRAKTNHAELRDKGRGRHADRPGEIPAAGWKRILWRVYEEMGDDRVTLVAAGVTYYLLLAIVPGLAAFVSLYGLFADPATVSDHLAQLRAFIPGGGMDVLETQLKRLASKGDTTLGLSLVISFAVSLWSANAGVKSLFEAMNVAYDERESRSFFKLNAISLSFTLSLIVVSLLMIGLAVVLPVLLGYLGLGTGLEWLISGLSLLLMIVVFSLGLAALYRWGPDRANAKWRWITPGAILTLVVTTIVSLLFSWYAANFGSYDATYGSLGALIGFMTWIWLTMIILIVGGELNSEMEHQTARDTTTGAPQPLGQRGAAMADRVAGKSSDANVSDRGRTPMTREEESAESKRRREGLSVGKLAVALPAALLLTYLKRRSERQS